jgi:hypothetical protein
MAVDIVVYRDSTPMAILAYNLKRVMKVVGRNRPAHASNEGLNMA